MRNNEKVVQNNKIEDFLTEKFNIQKEKIKKIIQDDKDFVDSTYKKIQSDFNPENLDKLSSPDLMYKLFNETNVYNNNLMYVLEFYGKDIKKQDYNVNKINNFFGSIKGGKAYTKFPFQITKNKKTKEKIWRRGDKELSNEEAIQITNDVKLFLKKVYGKINNYKDKGLVPKNSHECIKFVKEIYETIEEYGQWEFKEDNWPMDLFNNVWFKKYLHIMFPDIFSPYYNTDWQAKLLEILFDKEANKWQDQLDKKDKQELSFMVNSIRITNEIENRFNLENYQFSYYLSSLDDKKEKNKGNKKDKNNMTQTKENKNNTNKKGVNIIYYGAPGVGKSYKVQKEYDLDNKDKQVSFERVVFHPEYSYGDFVGQIKPDIKEENGNHLITYKFESGPFTKILKKAIADQENHHYLIIEEINRGNAHSIFGDLFQLLDRDKSGESEYEITNADIAKEVYQDKNHKIKIPSNLTIIATMNTSDQNVYTLDTAFQRRWEMKHISNEFTEEEEEKELKNSQIFDTDVSWGIFLEVINGYILDNSSHMSSLEDKRIGKYFINKNDFNEKRIDYFAHKVLKYLWDDAFKLNRESVLKDEFKSLDSIIKKFINSEGNERFKSIFHKEINDDFEKRILSSKSNNNK